MSVRSWIAILLLAGCSVTTAAEFPGAKSAWQGFDRYDFTVDGRRCWVVTPQAEAEGRPDKRVTVTTERITVMLVREDV